MLGSIGCGAADGGADAVGGVEVDGEAAVGAAGVSAGGGGGGTLGLTCCALRVRGPASKKTPKMMYASLSMARRLRFTLLSWMLPESGSPHSLFYSCDGTGTKSRQPSC
jgi:hypothetical protein